MGLFGRKKERMVGDEEYSTTVSSSNVKKRKRKVYITRQNASLSYKLKRMWKGLPKLLKYLIIILVLVGLLYGGMRFSFYMLVKNRSDILAPTIKPPAVQQMNLMTLPHHSPSSPIYKFYYDGENIYAYSLHTIFVLHETSPFITDKKEFTDRICQLSSDYMLMWSDIDSVYYLVKTSTNFEEEERVVISQSPWKNHGCGFYEQSPEKVLVAVPDGLVIVENNKIVASVRWEQIEKEIKEKSSNIPFFASKNIDPQMIAVGDFDALYTYGVKITIGEDNSFVISSIDSYFPFIQLVGYGTNHTLFYETPAGLTMTTKDNFDPSSDKTSYQVILPWDANSFTVGENEFTINNYSLTKGFFSNEFYSAQSFTGTEYVMSIYKPDTEQWEYVDIYDPNIDLLTGKYKNEEVEEEQTNSLTSTINTDVEIEIRDKDLNLIHKYKAIVGFKPVWITKVNTLIVMKNAENLLGFYNYEKSLVGETLVVNGYSFAFDDPFLFVISDSNLLIYQYKDTGLPDLLISIPMKGLSQNIEIVKSFYDEKNGFFVAIRNRMGGSVVLWIDKKGKTHVVTGMNVWAGKTSFTLFERGGFTIYKYPMTPLTKIRFVKGKLISTLDTYKVGSGSFVVGDQVVFMNVVKTLLPGIKINYKKEKINGVLRIGNYFYVSTTKRLLIVLWQDNVHYAVVGEYPLNGREYRVYDNILIFRDVLSEQEKNLSENHIIYEIYQSNSE